MIYKKKIPTPWVPVLKDGKDSTWFDDYPDSREPAKALDEKLEHLFDDF